MKTLLIYSPYLVAFFTYLTFVLRCDFKVRGQAVWTMALLACASKFVVFDALGSDAFAPELPERTIWLLDWIYSGFILLFLLGVITFFFRFRFKALVLPLIAWTAAFIGVYEGVREPAVEEVEVRSAKIPEELDGYRIVQISDIHVSNAARGWRTERIVEIANAENPDLTVVTGDIVDGGPDRLRADVEPLKNLTAKDGVYYIAGNHEFYYMWMEWQPWYELWGMRFLRNEALRIRPGLALGGLDDPSVKIYEPLSIPSARNLFNPEMEHDFRVLLQHRPKTNGTNNLELGFCDLQLSGHTHGGVAPGFDRLVARFNGGYVRGKYEIADGVMYVSPGAGQWAGLPVRFFNPPVVSVIVLRHL